MSPALITLTGDKSPMLPPAASNPFIIAGLAFLGGAVAGWFIRDIFDNAKNQIETDED